ncbi:hypothetical protein AVEN_241382-1 [Araneus ventricosus]|uniref:Uncharacterized protein n=1 Tax=Araneus ventricosus TaxID=182803 RepID=A0A4Y2MBC3_ARAVE|nr:hypothetical protein AVEN_241382-1 [Araneus ventricosus]
MKYDSHLAVSAIILLLTAGVFLGVGATNLSTRPLYSGPVCVVFGSLFLLASVLMCKYASKGPHPGPVVKIHRNPLRKVGQNIPHKQKSKTDPAANSQQDPSIKNWKNPAENTKERDKVEITRFSHTAV